MRNLDEKRRPGRHDDGAGAGEKRQIAFELRAMKLCDLDQVMEIEQEAFSEPWARGCFEHEILVLEASELAVAVQQDDIMGFTVAWFLDDKVHLANVAVRKRYRGQGIGRGLVEAVMSRARQVGAEKVVLEVRSSNLEAQKLYETLGFLQVGVRKDYYVKEKEDAILMACNLSSTRRGGVGWSGREDPGGTG